MRIGIMMRAIDERQGIGVYTRSLMDELLPMESSNEYVLYYRNPEYVGLYADVPRVQERVVPGKSKGVWDQYGIPKAARRDNVDLIFHPKFTVPLCTRRKTVMTIHGASWFVRPELYSNKFDLAYIKAVMPIYCKKADYIIANSDLTRDDFIRILHVPPEKIETIRLGASSSFSTVDDPATLAVAREKYRLPDSFILSVIRYDPRKNFENLIAAFRLLRKRRSCKLVVAGIDCDKYVDEYRLREDGTAEDVSFLGWVDRTDLPALYSLATCHFFPSVYEEFGIPTVEAMACGCPPVVSNTGALPEVAGDAGLIVDPFAPEEMADALERICTDAALRAELSRRSLERAKEFTWTRCAERTLEVLRRFA